MKAETTHVISQFADDAALFLTFSEECINAAIETLTRVECNTGLRISYEKTCIYRISSLKHTNAKVYTLKQLQWSDGDINMLGVKIKNEKIQNSEDLDSAICKIRSVMDTWHNRFLTLTGKIVLINTLMGSLFICKMSVLPEMTEKQLKQIDGIIKEFLWPKGKIKIPLKVLSNSKRKGGLKLNDFRKRHKALKLQWIKKLSESESLSSYVYVWISPIIGEKIWECNLSKNDVRKLLNNNTPTYWHDVLLEWAGVHFCEPQSYEIITQQIIYYNSLIKIGGEMIDPLCDLCKNGIHCVKQLVLENGTLMAWEEAKRNFGFPPTSWLNYYKLVQAIPSMWKTILQNNSNHCENIVVRYDTLVKKQVASRFLYQVLINQEEANMYNYAVKWYSMVKRNDLLCMNEFFKLFRKIEITTSWVKLRDFQYRLLLGKIFVNDVLYKWKIKNSAECDWCDIDVQSTSQYVS